MLPMVRILVVEDDRQIRDTIVGFLERDGYEVLVAGDGTKALEMARQAVDLVLLDVMIPKPDGLDVTRILRSTSAIPILIVSARAEESDRVAALELGADDYLTKPFMPRELLARVKALLRRSRLPSYVGRGIGPLLIDAEARAVWLDGEPIETTPREYSLLKTLASAPGKNFTREELLDRAWGTEFEGDGRRVDNYIHRLRGKLKRQGRPDLIRSIWGVGYKLES